jgi:hypothetical protein
MFSKLKHRKALKIIWLFLKARPNKKENEKTLETLYKCFMDA